MTDPAAPVVQRVDARNRYEILVDGKLAGHADYRDRDAQRVIHHTEIADAFAGRGLASLLVQRALTDVRDSGRRVVPLCPFVAKYLGRHDEFRDIADPVTPEVKRWFGTSPH
jgi:predicted GNAT family acetyltransferase